MTPPAQYTGYVDTEIGLLQIITDAHAVLSVEFVEDTQGQTDRHSLPPILIECCLQLNDYFAGERKDFTLPMQLQGTSFQKKAWEQLLTIPYGQTVSYGEQGRRLGNANTCRAVGGANNKNKLVILIPCHRVIGADGSLTGFGAGLWRKEWLLNHERWVLKNKTNPNGEPDIT